MRDQLIGYVLGALDAPEHEEVESQLGKDPWLREQLALLRRALSPLEYDREHHEPPAGLAGNTCSRVFSLEMPPANAPAPMPAGMSSSEGERGNAQGVRGWSLIDLAVAAGIVLAAGALFLPAINHSRFNAQVTNCQNNLAQIGNALHGYSQRDPAGEYPAIPLSGKLSAAGIYAPKLLASGQLSDAKVLRCGFSPGESSQANTIPSIEEIQSAKDDTLPELLGRAGGSYGYTMGYDQGGVYHPTKAGTRSSFPIMADAPSPKLDYQQSNNHGGYGQNVLFDDGHVRYLTTCRQPEGCPDHNFFRNAAGQIAAGVNPDDAVIGSSQAKPRGSSTTDEDQRP